MHNNESMFTLARMILNDACPPDNRMYLCKMGENDNDLCCNECWSNYLLWAVNGYQEDREPYRLERNKLRFDKEAKK